MADPSPHATAVVIGAGPAGLTAALELLRNTPVAPVVVPAVEQALLATSPPLVVRMTVAVAAPRQKAGSGAPALTPFHRMFLPKMVVWA